MGGLLCGCGAAGVVVLMASLLLRLAVALTNRLMGPGAAEKAIERVAPRGGRIAEWDWDDWDDEFEDRGPPPLPLRRRGQAIPEPGVLMCLGVVIVTAFTFGLACVLLIFAAESMGLRVRREESQLAVAVAALPVAFLTLSVMLVVGLPTTFWRAAMVAFLYGVILVGLGFGLVAAVFVLRVVVR
jgi:hypothetical protein